MPGVGGFAVSGPGNALVTGGFGTPTTMGLAAVPTRSFIANLDGQVSVTGAGSFVNDSREEWEHTFAVDAELFRGLMPS